MATAIPAMPGHLDPFLSSSGLDHLAHGLTTGRPVVKVRERLGTVATGGPRALPTGVVQAEVPLPRSPPAESG